MMCCLLFFSFHIVLLHPENDSIVTGYSRLKELLQRRNRDGRDVQQQRDAIFRENRGQQLKRKVEALVQWCIDEEDDGLLNLRNEVDHFMTFVDVCMVHLINTVTWNRITEATISNIFSPSDEAIGMLNFENHVDDFSKMMHDQSVIGRKESKPRYTKENGGSTKGGFKGWHRDGVMRYNTLMREVRTRRSKIDCERLEKRVMTEYREFSNKVHEQQQDAGQGESIDFIPGIDLTQYLVEAEVDNWASV